MASEGEGKVGGLLVCFELLESLPCVVHSRVQVVFAQQILDFLIFARCNNLAPISSLQSDCSERVVATILHSILLRPVPPESRFDINRHGLGNTMLDVRWKQVGVKRLQVEVFAMLIDSRTLPCDMTYVTGLLSTV